LAFLVVPAAAVASLPTDLAAVRDFLCQRIDADAEVARAQFLTPGEGQALTYFAKQMEAESLAADPDAPAIILRAEAAAMGVPVADLAQEVLAAVAAWTAKNAAIEAARRGAKKQISEAETLPAIKAAAALDWTNITASDGAQNGV